MEDETLEAFMIRIPEWDGVERLDGLLTWYFEQE